MTARITKAGELSVPAERSLIRAEMLREPYFDAAVAASAARLRRLGVPVIDDEHRSDELVSSATIVEAINGGSLRTLTGNLNHENGWWPSWRRNRMQFWEGEAARDFLVRSESDPRLDWVQSEFCRVEAVLDGKLFRYTADMGVKPVSGPLEIVEIKRDEDDLWDPAYRKVLGTVAEILRRVGRVFRVVLEHEIYENRHHRQNCELIASRRYVEPTVQQLARLEAMAIRDGPDTTYLALATAIEPECPVSGSGVVHGLTVRNRVELDLTTRLHDHTPVRIR